MESHHKLEHTPYFTAVENTLAHTTAQVVWHVQKANYAVVATILPDYLPWHHLFIELDGEWVLVQSTYFNTLPYYDSPDQKGIFVDIHPVADHVRGGRVSYQGQVVEVPAHAHYLCTVIWDVDASSPADKVSYRELLIDDRWQACIVPWYPATAQQFAETYLSYYRVKEKENQDKNWWAVDMLFAQDRHERLKLVLAVIDYADLSRDEYALGCLGAGPLEDLMSDWLLDTLEKIVPHNIKLKYALSMVRMEFEAESLQQRVAKLLT
ncbi:MAG: hypothetical protein KDJ52_15150 [Anaerolineae bacterium]|nr:hypothetical protein [Anaerolineae bacterium]